MASNEAEDYNEDEDFNESNMQDPEFNNFNGNQLNVHGMGGLDTIMAFNKCAVEEVSMSSRILDLEQINRNLLSQIQRITKENYEVSNMNTISELQIKKNKIYEVKINESRKETENLIVVLKIQLDKLVDNINALEETKVKQEMLIRNLNIKIDKTLVKQSEQIEKLKITVQELEEEINRQSENRKLVETQIASYQSMEQEYTQILNLYNHNEKELEMLRHNLQMETDKSTNFESAYSLLQEKFAITENDYSNLHIKYEELVTLCTTYNENIQSYRRKESEKRLQIDELNNQIIIKDNDAESEKKQLKKKLDTVGIANSRLMAELKEIEEESKRNEIMQIECQKNLQNSEARIKEQENIIKFWKNEIDILKSQIDEKETALLSANKNEEISKDLNTKLVEERRDKETIVNQLNAAKSKIKFLEERIKKDEEKKLAENKKITEIDPFFSKARKYRKSNTSVSSDIESTRSFLKMNKNDVDSDSSFDTSRINLPNQLIQQRYPNANKIVINPMKKFSQGVNLTQRNTQKETEKTESETTIPFSIED